MLLSWNLFISINVCLLGLIIGSFLNVCVYRIPLRLSFVAGRSFCPACKKTLAWYELFPVLSWLFLRGRCRRCKAKISPRYPLVELFNGLLWLLVYLRFGLQWHTLLLFFFVSTLLVAALIDWDTRLVPNGLVLFLLPLGVLEVFLSPNFLSITARVLGFFCLSAPMLLLALWKKGFGGGDIKLVAVCGLFLGWQLTLFGAFLACVTGCVHGLWLLLVKKKGRSASLPFVPHLATGFVVSALWGPQLLLWYINLWGLA